MVRAADVSWFFGNTLDNHTDYELAFWHAVIMVSRKGHSRSLSQSGVARKPSVATFQTRIRDYRKVERADGDEALSAYGELYGRVERKLFAEVAAGRSATSLKSVYLEQHGIPARMFNAVRVSLEGKAAAVREQQKLRLDALQRRIVRAERPVSDAGRTWSMGSGSSEAAETGQPATRAVCTRSGYRSGPSAAVLRVEAVVA